MDGKPHGVGVKSWPDGEKYSGDWYNPEPSTPPPLNPLDPGISDGEKYSGDL